MADILQRLFSLEGKTALITGATGGIGSALAKAFAEAGATIGVHGRDVAKAEALCAEIVAAGGKAIPVCVDLNTVAACRGLIADAQAQLGRLDIVFNNAGANRRKRIDDVTEDDFEALVGSNLRAIYFLCQAAHPIMKAQGGGKIIHIGSVNALYGLDGLSVYGLTKGGLSQLTKVQAVEWAVDNIQVNCLIPGFVRTPLTEVVWTDPVKARWLRSRIPMRRGGTPEEMVGAALLLASPASAYITGQNLVVDGGFVTGGSWLTDGAVE